MVGRGGADGTVGTDVDAVIGSVLGPAPNDEIVTARTLNVYVEEAASPETNCKEDTIEGPRCVTRPVDTHVLPAPPRLISFVVSSKPSAPAVHP